MSANKKAVFVVGAFPPPIHGLSFANSRISKFFSDAGFATVTLDTAHIHRRFPSTSKILRAIARLYVLCRLTYLCAAHGRNAILYMGASAGLGQVGEMPYPLVARLFGASIIVHHHSFIYLDRRSRVAATFFWLCGPGALHILLCDRMADLMRQKYSPKCVVVLSNAALMDIVPRDTPKEGRLRTIGFLGNITLDKGIDTFIELINLLRARNVEVFGRIAGPLVDADCRDLVEAAVGQGLITYCGPVYGDDKLEFLADIDILVMLSRYRNEAEPFVVLEALATGIPVIATRRGCTGALVDDENGVLLEAFEPDLDSAVAKIEFWVNHPDAFLAIRRGAISRMQSLLEDASAVKTSLVSKFLSD